MANTIFEGSRTSLRNWLTAIWLVACSDNSINAVKLSIIISVSYKTAWLMLNKIRARISDNDLTHPLERAVIGVPAIHGRPTSCSYASILPQETALIVAASIDEEDQVTDLKIKMVQREHTVARSLHNAAIHTFVDKHVSPSVSSIHIVQRRGHVRHHISLKQVYKQARRWMINAFHGIGAKYLQSYLDEFCYRKRFRTHDSHLLWESLLQMSLTKFYR